MCVDIAFPVAATPFFVMRENILRHNKALTGSRFLKGAYTIGGLKRTLQRKLSTPFLYI